MLFFRCFLGNKTSIPLISPANLSWQACRKAKARETQPIPKRLFDHKTIRTVPTMYRGQYWDSTHACGQTVHKPPQALNLQISLNQATFIEKGGFGTAGSELARVRDLSTLKISVLFKTVKTLKRFYLTI